MKRNFESFGTVLSREEAKMDKGGDGNGSCKVRWDPCTATSECCETLVCYGTEETKFCLIGADDSQ